MSDAKERIRERLDIAEVVGEVVALKSAGKGRLKGLCPFHGEKTPSFHVNQDRGFFYCFGCQAKGDVFDFVMRTQGVPFNEALQTLGQRAGIEVTPSTPRDLHKRDLYDVNKVALEFFRSHLPGIAEDYLLGRKLTRESVDAFELGYAPESWDGLLKYALTKGVKEADLLRAGLLAESDTGRRYDRFRNRVMFPIKDYLGRVVGFSGRVLDDSLPKYMNTPETDIFHKGELLYGLDAAKTTIRATGECLVVEGYMDVIALHQTGFGTAVAALGATLTAEQAGLLSRLEVQRLYLAFDADEVGQRAVLSGLEQSVGRQFLVKAIRVPHGKDPADAVLGGHVEAFRRALENGLSEVEYRVEQAYRGIDIATPTGEAAFLTRLRVFLRGAGPGDAVAHEYREQVSRLTQIPVDDLRRFVGKPSARAPESYKVTRIKVQDYAEVLRRSVATHMLLDETNLKMYCEHLSRTLPENDPLVHFAQSCAEHDHNVNKIISYLSNNQLVQTAFPHLVAGAIPPPSKFAADLQCYIKFLGIAPIIQSAPDQRLNSAHYIRYLLESNQLDRFGPSKLAYIKQKLIQNDEVWLAILARSKELALVLGLDDE